MAAAVSSRGGRNTVVVQIPRQWNEDREATPERARAFWSESRKLSRKAPVVYYLSRNGQLDHPHFMEVPLSSNDGLYLSDVISQLDLLRGKGMASLYSWSSKRSFKNGFVWQDLTENDFIHPAHGHEYILKGSEILDHSNQQLFLETKPQETSQSSASQASEFPVITRRRNQSLSSINLNEYKVYKAESFSESARKLAADASTQTDDSRRRRRYVKPEIKKMKEEKKISQEREANRDEIMEISPPPSDSSPETLESLMKADGRLILGGHNEGSGMDLNQTAKNCGKMKASTVLMQLISCSSSISFRDCGATPGKEPGLPLIAGHYKGRLPCGGGNREATSREIYNFSRVKLEEKEYFSGSLIETKKEEVPALNLKRSSSCSAARSSHLQLAEKEIEGVRTKCMPRKSRAMVTRRESSVNVVVDNDNKNNNVDSSQVGSKRLEVQQVQDEGR
ncbi:hypothetical protein H0E87_017951 [Populus deltoides]|uniref:SOSEKI DIX-like domain-containing protein n=2 Tax=Populus deltoides TaxID=3696 RepID=A0A8T2Y293_POPDE|nr:hypothetical protein H0E87_017951 [Populus deltoides]